LLRAKVADVSIKGARRAGLPEDQDDLALRSHLATIRYFLSRL